MKSEKGEIVVIGDALSASLLVEAFREQQHVATPLLLETPAPRLPRRLPIHLGNGEYYANARKVFGVPLAETLWEVSTANFRRARALGPRFGVQPAPKRLTWQAFQDREASLQRETVTLLPELNLRVPTDADGQRVLSILEEPCLLWSPLVNPAGTPIDELVRLEKQGLETIVHYRRKGVAGTIRASIVVLASEEIPASAVPFLADKWVPVTLSSFVFSARRPLPFAAAYCNGGADFAIVDGEGWRLGSFRNLYQDKAVGRHTDADPVTLEGVRRFFGEMGWIEPSETPKTELSYEALGCDGLPTVGALPDLPGVYVLGGFAGRRLNFLFELSFRLAHDIATGGDFQSLRAFSTKRFC